MIRVTPFLDGLASSCFQRCLDMGSERHRGISRGGRLPTRRQNRFSRPAVIDTIPVTVALGTDVSVNGSWYLTLLGYAHPALSSRASLLEGSYNCN